MSQLVISDQTKKLDNHLMMTLGLKESPIMEVVKLGSQVLAVKDWLKQPEVFSFVKALMGKSTGFLVDARGCTDDQLREAVTEALLNGFRLTNNEFNIISGRFMAVLNGYMRRVSEYENESIMLTDLQIIIEDMEVMEKTVNVTIVCKYAFLDKKSQTIKQQPDFRRVVFLTTKERENADAWAGKARRRVLKDLLAYLTGKIINDYDWEDPDQFVPKPVVGTTIKKNMEVKQEEPKKEESKKEENDSLHLGAPNLGDID